MKKHKKTRKLSKFSKKEIIRSLVIVVAVVVVIAVLLGLLEKSESRSSDKIVSQKSYLTKNTIEYDGVEYERKTNIETLLVMGLDKNAYSFDESYNSEYQADFLMLLVLDHKNEEYSAVHINRDTMTDMTKPHADGKGSVTINKQLALAYSYEDGDYNSCLNTAQALENVFANVLGEVEIDEHMSVTMNAVKIINNSVGGVPVEVSDDFSSVEGAERLIKGKTVVLEDDEALIYVRERYGMEDSSNSTRMIRQQQYLKSLLAEGKNAAASDEYFVLDTLTELSEEFISSYNLTALANTVECVIDYKFNGFCEIDGTSEVVDGHVQFTPSKESLQNLVLDLFYIPVENSD